MLQQASELALKAVYLRHGWRFAFTHDLGQLLDGLEKKGIVIPPDIQNADQLTVFATQTRYPGISPPVTQEHHAQAAVVADAVVRWAGAHVDAENDLV
jgi:HEPN domain-containing protein